MRSSLQVLFLVLVLGPPKVSKIVKDFTFCKQSIMYDHVKSINSVTATMHEDMVQIVLLTNVRYYLLIYVSK